MRIFWVIIVTLLTSTALATAQETERTIYVTGTGNVQAAPDMAVISLAITHQSREAKDAMDDVSDDMATMLDRLASLGIETRDIQTDRFSLRPVWDQRSNIGQQTRKIVGFVASNGVSVRVRDLPALGGILDAVIADGANDFSGLRFTLQDPKPQRDAARAAAVADAIDRATQLANAAGVTLGPIRKITEQGGQGAPVMMEMASLRRSDVPIAAGEVGVTASVAIEFDILP